QQRAGRYQRTSPDLGMKVAEVTFDRQYQMADRPLAVLGVSREHTGPMRLHREAEILEHRLEQQIVLNAVPAPLLEQELLFEVAQLQPHRQSHQRRQVLERYRCRVQHVQLLEGGEGRCYGAGKVYTLEIGVDAGV